MKTIRQQMIDAGVLRPSPALRAMYMDAKVGGVDIAGPTWEQPWHRNDPGLRLGAPGRAWADIDVQTAVEYDYYGQPPSVSALNMLFPGVFTI